MSDDYVIGGDRGRFPWLRTLIKLKKRVPGFAPGHVRLKSEIRGISATLMERRVQWRADGRVEPASQLAKLLAQVDEDPTAIY